ncbi:hypothetical protein HDV05_008310, partial [Chytridiales sp. JEL 0842]
VDLTELGKKNYIKLLNPATKKIREPPAKKCQRCLQEMDWRLSGSLQRRQNGTYTYQGYCHGNCKKIAVNIEGNAKALTRRRTNIESQIDSLAGAMSQRCAGTREMCINRIINVALNGSVAGGLYLSRAKEQRHEAYEQLEHGNGAKCYHCGVQVTWTAFAEH